MGYKLPLYFHPRKCILDRISQGPNVSMWWGMDSDPLIHLNKGLPFYRSYMQVLGTKHSGLCPQEAHWWDSQLNTRSWDSVMGVIREICARWHGTEGKAQAIEGRWTLEKACRRGGLWAEPPFHKRNQVCWKEQMTEGIPERDTAWDMQAHCWLINPKGNETGKAGPHSEGSGDKHEYLSNPK